MSVRLRVFFFALLVGTTTGVLSLFARFFLDGSLVGSLADLFTLRGFLEILLLWIVTVLPASLPMTVAGSAIAAHIANGRPRWPLRSWIVLGCVGGALLGALGCVLWFGGLTGSVVLRTTWTDAPQDMVRYLLDRALSGASAGIAAGAIVGAFCWRETRQ